MPKPITQTALPRPDIALSYLRAVELPHLIVGNRLLARPENHHDISHALRNAGIPVAAEICLWMPHDCPALFDCLHALATLAPWNKARWINALSSGDDGAYFKAGVTLYRHVLRGLDNLGMHTLLAHPLAESTHRDQLSLAERIIGLKEAGLDLNETDPLQRTALHVAAQSGHRPLLCALLEAGARPDARDALGYTPLHTAVAAGQGAIQDVLIAANVDIDCSDLAGNTPLHLAAANNDLEAIARLLKGYACTALLNHHRQRPIDVAHSADARAHLSRASAMINLRSLNRHLPLSAPSRTGSFMQSNTRLLNQLATLPGIRIVCPCPPGLDTAQWADISPLLEECGVPLDAGTAVWVEKSSPVSGDLARGLTLKARLKALGKPLSSVLFSGENRADVESLCALIRTRLTHPDGTHALIHRMATHATEADDTHAATGISLTERLRLLESAIAHAHPAANGPATRWLQHRDPQGRTPLELALAHGNAAMAAALREVLAQKTPSSTEPLLPGSLPLFAFEEPKEYAPTPSLSTQPGLGPVTATPPLESNEVSSPEAVGPLSFSPQPDWSALIAPQQSVPTSSQDQDETVSRGTTKERDTPGSANSIAG